MPPKIQWYRGYKEGRGRTPAEARQSMGQKMHVPPCPSNFMPKMAVLYPQEV